MGLLKDLILQIVLSWAKKVAWQRRLPKEQIAQTHATILTYGSYGLGVSFSPFSFLPILLSYFVGSFLGEFYFFLIDAILVSSGSRFRVGY